MGSCTFPEIVSNIMNTHTEGHLIRSLYLASFNLIPQKQHKISHFEISKKELQNLKFKKKGSKLSNF